MEKNKVCATVIALSRTKVYKDGKISTLYLFFMK